MDDELGVLEMHARIVEAQLPSCRVLRARDGREALDAIRQKRPDLVLLDLMMPELDGFGVLKAMQEGETTRDIPVVVLTGQVLVEEDMERLNRGVAAVLGKGLFSVEASLARQRRLGSEGQRTARRAMAYFHEHYAGSISRADVTHHLGVTQDHLTRVFRQEVGVTPIAYLNRYWLKRARTLLKAGEKSVTEIAMAVGFSSPSHFSRLFRREVGTSPSVYRRSHSAG